MSWFKKNVAEDKPAVVKITPEMYEVVVQSIREGVAIVGARGDVELINPAGLEIVELSREEALGLNFMSVLRLASSDGSALREELNPISVAFLRREIQQTRELIIIGAKSGKRVAVEIIVVPSSIGVVVSFRDITKELKEESEQAEFISTASHEMRTPVASIEGFLGLALNESTATIDTRAREYLTKAHEASQHLGKLFADLLDTTKLDDNRLKAELKPVEMTSLVEEICAGMMPKIAEKQLGYSFNGSGSEAGRTRLAQVLYANVDPDFLREILSNLIDNAIKYTASGGIRVDVTGDEKNVIVSIADTGMGIAPTDLTHIFEKFYRADNSDTRTIGGTGLGLYIVRQRAEAMNGLVTARSEVGKGSVFYVMVPRLSTDAFERMKLARENQQQFEQGSVMENNLTNGQSQQLGQNTTEMSNQI
jgi:PAS domain S-box-containing protein